VPEARTWLHACRAQSACDIGNCRGDALLVMPEAVLTYASGWQRRRMQPPPSAMLRSSVLTALMLAAVFTRSCRFQLRYSVAWMS
jgi:hypothetical protein